jgi:hypothetical protein
MGTVRYLDEARIQRSRRQCGCPNCIDAGSAPAPANSGPRTCPNCGSPQVSVGFLWWGEWTYEVCKHCVDREITILEEAP